MLIAFVRNVVKTFYTAGILIDVLTNFNKGELSEDLLGTRKYAKWKAAYINQCLKNGETPHSGPLPDEESNEDQDEEGPSVPVPPSPYQPMNSVPQQPDTWSAFDPLKQPQQMPSSQPSPSSSSTYSASAFVEPTVNMDTIGGGLLLI